MIGTIKWYDAQKGYGFIRPAGDGNDIFFHRQGIDRAPGTSDPVRLQTGDEVTFFIQLSNPANPASGPFTPPARPCAVDVCLTKRAALRPVRRGGVFTHANDKTPDRW